MPLVSAALASKMIQATNNAHDAASANLKLGKAIADYVKQNAVIMYSWVGATTTPPPVPDPVVATKGGFIFLEINIVPNMAVDPVSALTGLAFNIWSGFLLSVINITDPTFKTTPAKIVPPALILSPSNLSEHVSAMNYLANSIVTWILSIPLAIPSPGNHVAFVGIGTPLKMI